MFHEFQSPSLRGSGRFRADAAKLRKELGGFNPLHCGAVVTSDVKPRDTLWAAMFQSPSLRGSGRFMPPSPHGGGGQGGFQSPSLRGSGRFAMKLLEVDRDLNVSIPFIAGQWSLLPRFLIRFTFGIMFQSPSLRGSGRFDPLQSTNHSCSDRFQSPSLRGSGRFTRAVYAHGYAFG